MRPRIIVSTIALLVTALSASATVLFSDGFESYTAGGAPLDKNTAGANAAPNGSGQPWFGPAPPNARVVGADSTNGPTVTPHSGNNMIRGSAPSDLDENWVNLAYRFNGGNPFSGNIALDFWFYDPLGSGGSSMRDYAALGYYNTAPGNTDYPGTGSLNGSTQIQRISLGAGANLSTGYDSTKYQARIAGASDGFSAGWFNLPLTRSVGWHEGLIVIGPDLGDHTNQVSFYIDDLVNPLLVHNTTTGTPWGYNVIELNTNQGATTGYFDDISFSTIPEPASVLLLLGGMALLRRRTR